MEKLAEGYGLIEGPVWDPDNGLIFSDVIHGGVHCLREDGTVDLMVAHRRGIGGIVLHGDGGLVVGGRNISIKTPGVEGGTVLLDRDPDHGLIGFNDLTADSTGRIYVGGLAFQPVGAEDEVKPSELFCIELDGSVKVVGHDVMLTNGLAFSADGRTLYHSESRRYQLRAYDVDDDGGLGPHRQFAATIGDGVPDGLAVAVDGSVWVAIARGGRIDVYEADGSLRQSIAMSHPMPTSLCFGGKDMRDLYVVTGSSGTDSDRGGAVYRLRVDVPGLVQPPARIRPAA